MHTSPASRARAYGAFATAAARYWASAWPLAHQQIDRWHRRALTIPDPDLRAAALANLRHERGNLEGAAAFAVLAARRRRPALVTALVAFQVIYDYVDTLVEQPDRAHPETARRLHQALHDAVAPALAPNAQPYYDDIDDPDGGYLAALVASCRAALAQLPGSATAAPLAAAAATRMIDYQAHNHAPGDPDRTALAAWSTATTPSGSGLAWWEHAASSASSLSVFALLAHAASDRPSAAAAGAIAEAYVPVGALHVMLDSLADRDQDALTGDHSLIAHYANEPETIGRLAALAGDATAAVRQLPAGATHAAICAAMAAYYLAALDDDDHPALVIAAPLGATVRPALFVLRARRRFG